MIQRQAVKYNLLRRSSVIFSEKVDLTLVGGHLSCFRHFRSFPHLFLIFTVTFSHCVVTSCRLRNFVGESVSSSCVEDILDVNSQENIDPTIERGTGSTIDSRESQSTSTLISPALGSGGMLVILSCLHPPR